MPGVVTSTASRVVLTLDGQPMAVQAFDGGHARGEVVASILGPQQDAKKQIGRVMYEPLSVSVMAPFPEPVARWLEAWSEGAAGPKDGSGALVSLDGRVLRERRFSGALISELTIPAMDAGSKDVGSFTIRMHAERIEYGKRDASAVAAPLPGRQKPWLASNFRFRLGDLPPGAVAGVESFTIRQGITVAHAGRAVRLEQDRIEFPNLKVALGGRDTRAWEDWFERFVIDGDNAQHRELHGAIELLAATGEPIGSIELSQVGIFALTPPAASPADAMARFTAELYVERMIVRVKSA